LLVWNTLNTTTLFPFYLIMDHVGKAVERALPELVMLQREGQWMMKEMKAGDVELFQPEFGIRTRVKLRPYGTFTITKTFVSTIPAPRWG